MELGKDYTIRSLSQQDNLKKFKTGDPAYQPLKAFLSNQAINFQIALVAQTYVAVTLDDNNRDTGNVIGFITLTCSEIDLRNGYSVDDCEHANKYDSLPAVKIARLAVDKNYRTHITDGSIVKGKRIGEMLVNFAIAITVDMISSQVGCRFLITDSKKPAVGFYEKIGFTFLDTEDNRNSDNPILFIDLKKI